MKSIIWLRNDLRTLDNPALWHACQSSEEVIAIYVVAEKQWKKHGDARCKVDFWLRSLQSLEKSLKKLNIPLQIIDGVDYQNTTKEIFKLIYKNDVSSFGAIAQLVEHLHGMQGVRGSNPLGSIEF